MSDEKKNVFSLVPKSKQEQQEQHPPEYLAALEDVIQQIRDGSDHAIILVDEEGSSSYISNLYADQLHWEASKLAANIMQEIQYD